jgi:hypothetical protein
MGSPEKQIIFNTYYSVETFFFIRYEKINEIIFINFIAIIFISPIYE